MSYVLVANLLQPDLCWFLVVVFLFVSSSAKTAETKREHMLFFFFPLDVKNDFPFPDSGFTVSDRPSFILHSLSFIPSLFSSIFHPDVPV